MVAPGSFSRQSYRWKRAIAALVIVLVVAIAVITGASWQRLMSSLPLTIAQSSGNVTQVGLVETEAIDEVPFWVWVVLPRLFPEKLPGAGGYTSHISLHAK